MKRQPRHGLLVGAAALLLATTAACAQGPRGEWRAPACDRKPVALAPQAAQASRLLRVALREDSGSAITAAVFVDGRLVWSDAAGEAKRGAPITPAAQARIASLSKLFTAAAAVKLAEQGRLDVDAPVATYVPEFKGGREFTVRQLASHMSGVRQYDFSDMSEGNNTRRYESLDEALAVFNGDPLKFRAGEQTHYTSLGYNLLGVVVERASGLKYEAAVQALVAQPIGLKDVALDDARRTVPCRPDFATVWAGRMRTGTPWRDSSDYYPSGGLLSTAEDLARFADATFNGPYLSEESRRLVTTPVKRNDGAEGPYAFGWEVRRTPDGAVLWYGGGGNTNGSYATLRYYPAQRVAIASVATYNFALTKQTPAYFRFARQELPALFGAPTPPPTPPAR